MDRNLRRCIHKAGVTLDLELELVETTIQLKKPKLMVRKVFWPCFSMNSWIQTLSTSFPEYVFGGFRLEEEKEWRSLFKWFWSRYRRYDSDHPIYQVDAIDTSLCIPMVQSFQFLISHLGPYTTNTSGKLALKKVIFKCTFLV